jgi:hypothetical protein
MLYALKRIARLLYHVESELPSAAINALSAACTVIGEEEPNQDWTTWEAMLATAGYEDER